MGESTWALLLARLLAYSLVVFSGASMLTPESLGFLDCQMGMIIIVNRCGSAIFNKY